MVAPELFRLATVVFAARRGELSSSSSSKPNPEICKVVLMTVELYRTVSRHADVTLAMSAETDRRRTPAPGTVDWFTSNRTMMASTGAKAIRRGYRADATKNGRAIHYFPDCDRGGGLTRDIHTGVGREP